MKKAFSFGAEDRFCIASPRRTCKNFGAICLAPFCILLTSSAEALGVSGTLCLFWKLFHHCAPQILCLWKNIGPLLTNTPLSTELNLFPALCLFLCISNFEFIKLLLLWSALACAGSSSPRAWVIQICNPSVKFLIEAFLLNANKMFQAPVIKQSGDRSAC